jgi:2'-hydroxyisoflavone reductase
VNAVGPSTPFGGVLEQAAAVAGTEPEFVPREDEWLLDHDVRYWAGPRSLPLWLPRADVGFAQRSDTAFLRAGGVCRPLEATLADVLEDEERRGTERPRRSGLTDAEESELLDSSR